MSVIKTLKKYGTKEHTLQLLEMCQKGSHMDCWEALFI
jgi:hypothetical protein